MEYKLLYRWQETWAGETGLDGKPLQDFMGVDRDVPIGRIRLEDSGPNVRHQGFSPTAQEASPMVEDYYHRLMRHNEMRGSQDVD